MPLSSTWQCFFVHLGRLQIATIATCFLLLSFLTFQARAQSLLPSKYSCQDPNDPNCCPSDDRIQAAIPDAKMAAAKDCLETYQKVACCRALKTFVGISIDFLFISIQSQLAACRADMQDALVQVLNETFASPIAYSCSISLSTIENLAPPSLPCPVTDQKELDLVVDNQLVSACSSALPAQACVGACWKLILEAIQQLVQMGTGTGSSLAVKQGCLLTIIRYLDRRTVNINTINRLVSCQITSTPGPPPPPQQKYKANCPVDASRLGSRADLQSVFITCNDGLAPAQVCTKCLSTIIRASSQVLQPFPDLQRELVGGCFVLVTNALALQLPPNSYLIPQITNCLESPQKTNAGPRNGTSTTSDEWPDVPCPVDEVNKIPGQSVLEIDAACDLASLIDGQCVLCQGVILPAILSIPGIDPRNDKQLENCFQVITQTYAYMRAVNKEHADAVTACFASTSDALAPGASPYETEELSPLPDFPLEAPKAAPTPAPAPAPDLPVTPPPAPAPGPDEAFILNISIINPNTLPNAALPSCRRHPSPAHISTCITSAVLLLLLLLLLPPSCTTTS